MKIKFIEKWLNNYLSDHLSEYYHTTITRVMAIVLTASVVSFTSCADYDNTLNDIEDRLDRLEGTPLTSIQEQITKINNSLDTLQDMDDELDRYIESLQNTASDLQSKINDTNEALAALESNLEGQISKSEETVLKELNNVEAVLEGQLATINNTIATLQAKDAELDQKIADLQTYVDSEISATENWANATFSTLEQYNATQTAISEINALINSTQDSITALEKKLNKKIADDIAAAVADVNADIAAKVTEITDGYTAAIATAKKDITAAYTAAIKTAITASETSMKKWVNGVLANGYYTKAEINGKITVLQTQVTEGDAALQKEIDDLKAALAKAEKDLTDDYKKAIEDAITENNGKISAEIAAAVKTAQDNLQAQIDAINSEIEKIKERLDIIEADIKTINQQITAINGSIKDLKDVDSALQTLIDDLEAEAVNLQQRLDDNAAADVATKKMLEREIANINALITELKKKNVELDQKIADLQSYVDSKITATEDWTNATFATLTQYEAVQTEIATIKAIIEQHKSDITVEYTTAIEDAISTSEVSMKTWVNEQLQQPLADIAELKAALEKLAANTATDDELAAAVAAQQAALEQAKSDLTAAYVQAISDAVANGGVINQVIASAVEAASNALQSQINDIRGEIRNINSRLTELEKNFANRIQSVRYIPEYSDGMVVLDVTTSTLELTFIITPVGVAQMIAEAYDASNKIVTAWISRTSTRAIDMPTEILVNSVTANNEGFLFVEVDASILPEDYWNDTAYANMYIRVNDGINDVVSELIPTCYDK